MAQDEQFHAEALLLFCESVAFWAEKDFSCTMDVQAESDLLINNCVCDRFHLQEYIVLMCIAQ